MKRMVYMALTDLAGRRLLHRMPLPMRPLPEQLPDLSCAVYAVEDENGKVCYVGSVYRPADPHGLASHIGEYLREDPRTSKWSRIYVLPLQPSTSEVEVRRFGGKVAGWLLPYDRERWPQAS
ncbi:hypothetical protein [Streptosporangium carneum]|uniref:GIY-YIG domain-containing protein n=1 Tax=Streptosporangium carneum TaxID=47481 RepID=A0A9W6MES9_9ACTN|nr:hypothetical protein [Streptosporangium carneum]GLK11143.1 hypothetical protein GCM10017600_45490 [Streptosporangium carneum]